MEIKTIVLPRSTWLRGEGAHRSFLLRVSDSKRCCIGVLCAALGVPDEAVRDVRAIDDLADYSNIPSEICELPRHHTWNGESYSIAAHLYDLNDVADMSDEDRVSAMNGVLDGAGCSFRFELGPE